MKTYVTFLVWTLQCAEKKIQEFFFSTMHINTSHAYEPAPLKKHAQNEL